MAKGKTLRLSTAKKSRRLRKAAYERRRDGAPPPVPRRSPCFGPCVVCNRYPRPGTKLKSAKYRLCKSCYNLKLREAKPKAKPKAKALNVELRRLRDRQRRQGIYSTGAQPLPRLTRAQSKAYEGLPVIAISSLFSAGGFLDSQFKGFLYRHKFGVDVEQMYRASRRAPRHFSSRRWLRAPRRRPQ